MSKLEWKNDRFLGEDYSEDGIEVHYTGSSIYHVTDKDGSYDAKITTKSDGSTHYYSTSDNWGSHSHDVVSSDGKEKYSRSASEDSKKHPWETRDDD